MLKRVAVVLVAALSGAATASAQSSSGGTAQPPTTQQPAGSTATTPAPTQPTSEAVETRPATTTTSGDTGLWFVPTGEVLPAKRWSLSAYRVNFDRDQGFSDVSDWPVTFGVGAGDRAEFFGAWTLVRRIDRDVRPLFVPGEPIAGGVVNEHPSI
jgi:hypothetical protein